MKGKGIYGYVPRNVIEELKKIEREEKIEGIRKRHKAFDKMLEHAQVGKEMEKLRNKFLFVRKKK